MFLTNVKVLFKEDGNAPFAKAKIQKVFQRAKYLLINSFFSKSCSTFALSFHP